MFSYKTKTNQAWALDAPLEIWHVSTNEKGERVKEKANKSEVPALEEGLDEVLRSGKMPRNEKNRGELLVSLSRASAALSLDKSLPPLKLVGKIETIIERLSNLLGDLKPYRCMFDMNVPIEGMGTGIADFVPSAEFRLLPVRGTVLIRMQKLLSAWHDAVKKLPRTEPNAPNDDVTREIVRYAVEFFSDHSAKKPSTTPSNPVQTFAVHYYKWITGEDRESLDWHIRKVLKETGDPKARSKAGGKSPKKADVTS